MAAYGLLTMYNLTASIGTQKTGEAPSQSWTYVELSEGIDNVAEALNETVQQYFSCLMTVLRVTTLLGWLLPSPSPVAA